MAKTKKAEPAQQTAGAPESEYDRIARRVLAAAEEMNAALKEAHEFAEMRVFLRIDADSMPANIAYSIYRLTHSVIRFKVHAQEPAWKVFKDPALQPVTGARTPATER